MMSSINNTVAITLAKVLVIGIYYSVSTLAFSQTQTIYRWEDEQGVTHFNQRASNQHNATVVNGKDLPAVNSSVSMLPNRESNLQTSTSKSPSRQQAKVVNHAKTAQLCQNYNDKLQRIQATLKRGYKEPQGNQLRQQRRKYSSLLLQHCH